MDIYFVRSFVQSFCPRSLTTTTALQYLIFSFRCAQTTDRQTLIGNERTSTERGEEDEEGTETKFYQSPTHSTVTDERVLLNCQSHYTVLICCWLFFSLSLSLSSLSLTCPTAKTSRINRFVTNHHDIHPLFFFFCTHTRTLSLFPHIAAIERCFRRIGGDGNTGRSARARERGREEINTLLSLSARYGGIGACGIENTHLRYSPMECIYKKTHAHGWV